MARQVAVPLLAAAIQLLVPPKPGVHLRAADQEQEAEGHVVEEGESAWVRQSGATAVLSPTPRGTNWRCGSAPASRRIPATAAAACRAPGPPKLKNNVDPVPRFSGLTPDHGEPDRVPARVGVVQRHPKVAH